MRRVELSAAGVHPETLARLVQEGTLTRFTRGLYQLGDADITAPHELAEVAKLAPKGVICLSPPCSSTNSRCKCRVESGLP